MEPEPAPPTTPRGGRARRLTGKLGVKSTDSAQDAKAPEHAAILVPAAERLNVAGIRRQ